MWTTRNNLLTRFPHTTHKSASGTQTIFAFDFDHTLVSQKSGKLFPVDANDWKITYPNVHTKLKEILKEEHNVVIIFSNQAGIEGGKVNLTTLCKRIDYFMESLGGDVVYYYAAIAKDHYRKPSVEMWKQAINDLKIDPSHIDMENSVYVGDAAGRIKGWKKGAKKDFTCSDRKFAANIGIPFQTPEEFFLGETPCNDAKWEWRTIDPIEHLKQKPLFSQRVAAAPQNIQEMILLVGPPASGKSRFCSKYFPKYVRINRDTLKTKAKCIKAAKEALGMGKSVIIDNTNPTADNRAEYIGLLSSMGIGDRVSVRAIVFDISKEMAYHLNQIRVIMTKGERRAIPKVGFNMFYKRFQSPMKVEGIDEIVRIPFQANFDNEEHKTIFCERT